MKNFLQNFNSTVSLDQSIDLPEVPWSRRMHSDEVEPEFMNQFVLACLDKYQNPEDSLISDLPKKKNAKMLKGFYLSKRKHPKDTSVAALLIDLIEYQGKEHPIFTALARRKERLAALQPKFEITCESVIALLSRKTAQLTFYYKYLSHPASVRRAL
ncbi:MAG: hypothetical protein HC880_12365 [Bacteroidia bacterium]|nr:hypothetical protein [Bacteroidia bacterium]